MVQMKYGPDLSADGCIVSTKTIPTPAGDLLVRYSPETLVAHIFIANDPDKVLDSWISKSVVMMRRDIKTRLIKLGATFEYEGRRNHNAAE